MIFQAKVLSCVFQNKLTRRKEQNSQFSVCALLLGFKEYYGPSDLRLCTSFQTKFECLVLSSHQCLRMNESGFFWGGCWQGFKLWDLDTCKLGRMPLNFFKVTCQIIRQLHGIENWMSGNHYQ